MKYIYLIYLYFLWILKKITGIRSYGIGVITSIVKKEFLFYFNNSVFIFSPNAGRSYGFLPIGRPNEPGTHIFLNKIIKKYTNIVFIDIGASIGEFAISMASVREVKKVIAIEPQPETRAALLRSFQLIEKEKYEVLEYGISDYNGIGKFEINSKAPMGARIASLKENIETIDVTIKRLDDCVNLKNTDDNLIILIDIEGGELMAIRGAKNIIKKYSPLIIFEYNDSTKKYFSLDDMRSEIPNYSLYNLDNENGELILDLDRTWNIVALPNNGVWNNIVNDKFF